LTRRSRWTWHAGVLRLLLNADAGLRIGRDDQQDLHALEIIACASETNVRSAVRVLDDCLMPASFERLLQHGWS